MSLAIVRDMAEPVPVDLRCPQGRLHGDECDSGRLLARLQLSGPPSFVQPDNLVELECRDCKSRLRREGRAVARVLHRFDMSGELITTLVVEL